jgi:riboflavin synthase
MVFTGLIEAVGTVRSLNRHGRGGRLEIEAQWPDQDSPRQGDSVAVNGACLTVLQPGPDGFSADLSSETVSRTLLGELRHGTPVNLERALRLGDRLGGHLVQGHVDTVVRLLAVTQEGQFARWRISLPGSHASQVADKGSVTLDGVSLTVAARGTDWFEVALIPETLQATVLGRISPGARLHLETDVLAKYVANIIAKGRAGSAIEEVFGSLGSRGDHA